MHAKTRGSLRTDDGEEDGVAGVGLPVHLRDPTQDGPERGHHLGLQTSTGNDTEEVLSAHIFCFRIFCIHTRRSCPGLHATNQRTLPQICNKKTRVVVQRSGTDQAAFLGLGLALALTLALVDLDVVVVRRHREDDFVRRQVPAATARVHPAHMFRQRHGRVRVRACKRRGTAAAQGARAIGGRLGQHRR